MNWRTTESSPAVDRGPSLRLRLTLWTTVVSLIIQLVLATIVYLYQKNSIDDLFEERIRRRATIIEARLAEMADRPIHHADLDRMVANWKLPPASEGFIAAVYSSEGQELARVSWPTQGVTTPFSPDILKGDSRRSTRIWLPDLRVEGDIDPTSRVLATSAGTGEKRRVIVVATTDTPYESLTSLNARVILLSLLVGLIGTALATWLVAGLAIKPLRRLHEMAQALTPAAIREPVKDVVVAPPVELAAFQRELTDARERLRLAFNAQDRLISNVSHELKTPIAVLLVESDTIDAKQLSADGQRFVQSVRHEMRGLGKMIDNFLMLTRVTGGRKLTMQHRRDINDLVLEAAADSKITAEQRGVSLRVQLAESSTPPIVVGDDDLLVTMLDHLIRNSIRSSPRQHEVSITVLPSDRTCRILIRDRGRKVSSAALASLFDWFKENNDSCDERKDLSLSVAQGIAELHGGKITASNADGGGCEFTLELPIAEPTDAALTETATSSVAAPSEWRSTTP